VSVLCAGGLTAIGAQLRCLDAAREAARLAARGDDQAAAGAIRASAPRGAVLRMRRDGEFVIVEVSMDAAPLFGFTIAAEAVSAIEPTS
jgi:hypothetical protein